MADGVIYPFRPRPSDPPEPEDEPGTDLEVPVDAEVVEYEPGAELVPAHPVVAAPWRLVERKPVVPVWLSSPEQRRKYGRWALGHVWHLTRFHLLRVPVYLLRFVARVPVGAGRVVAVVARWAADWPTSAYARDVPHAEVSAYVALQRIANERRKTRAKILAGAGVLGLVGWAVLHLLAPPGTGRWLLAGMLMFFGLVGRRERGLLDHAVLTQRDARLTPLIVARAFYGAGLGKDETNPISFESDPHRDGGGWRVVVDLPYGVTADKAIKRRTEIASGLDRDERCVFLTRVRGASGSARRVALWVADEDPLSVPAGPSPLMRTTRTSFWTPFPFGVDERGNVVMLSMLWLSLLIGAVPRMGKTFVARTIALAAALDPDVRLYVYDLKGSPDWSPFRHVAHRLYFGDRPDPDTKVDPVERLLADMRELQAEVDHRYRTLRTMPAELVPEGKLTEELARNRHADMPLVLVTLDEVQRAFEHPAYGKELEEVLTDLAKVAPAVGIMIVAATQKPDKHATPSRFRDQFLARFAGRVTSWQVSDVILGAGAYGEGFDASRLDPAYKGCGLLRGTGDVEIKGGTVRTFLADGRDAEAICLRARALRQHAGTLSGAALGEVETPPELPAWSLVADLLAVMGRDEQAHSVVLCERLAQQWPERYHGWGPNQLSAGLKPHGVETRQVWATKPNGTRGNLYGVVRADLEQA